MDAPIFSVKPQAIPKEEQNYDTKEPKGGWDYSIWVVHGEGMPGNWAFVAYLLPFSIAEAGPIPRHPMMWRKALKEGKSHTFECDVDPDWKQSPPIAREKEWYAASWELLEKGGLVKPLIRPTTYGYGYPSHSEYDHKPATKQYDSSPATKPATPQKANSALPANTRFRCRCGHWFKETDLPGHSKVCPAIQGGDADFAVFCDDKCGCELIKDYPTEDHVLGHKTLDHVSRCKPGFPRATKGGEGSTTTSSDGQKETGSDSQIPATSVSGKDHQSTESVAVTDTAVPTGV
jgi:hypothetical protein